jgi:hypothetical protein
MKAHIYYVTLSNGISFEHGPTYAQPYHLFADNSIGNPAVVIERVRTLNTHAEIIDAVWQQDPKHP